MRDKYVPIVLLALAATISSSLPKKEVSAFAPEYTRNQDHTVVKPLISDNFTVVEVDRVQALEAFFDHYKSPLKESSEKFVEVADKYEIDYRLLPSIACMESTCGKRVIPGSYNPFGWGVYGGKYISFSSWDDGIETVGKGLKEKYFNKGLDTLAEIAPIYTPPRSGHWYNGVSYFFEKITRASERS